MDVLTRAELESHRVWHDVVIDNFWEMLIAHSVRDE